MTDHAQVREELDTVCRHIEEMREQLGRLYRKRDELRRAERACRPERQKSDLSGRNRTIADSYNNGSATLRDLSRHYGLSDSRIAQIVKKVNRLDSAKSAVAKARSDTPNIKDIPLTVLGLSTRVLNVLHYNMGMRTFGELLQKEDYELLREPNFGLVSLDEIRNLKKHLLGDSRGQRGEPSA